MYTILDFPIQSLVVLVRKLCCGHQSKNIDHTKAICLINAYIAVSYSHDFSGNRACYFTSVEDFVELSDIESICLK